MFSEVGQDFHVIQVTVDRVQVLHDRKSHISFICVFYMWAKNTTHSQHNKNWD